ncbi:methyltransferase domain-containing protein [Frateuria edaphi]|uniref:pseudaminic acid biosynthesis-associated methylase n=1 Tax=Frateuria edaphi TaxID=2898793 RepID=UPI001E6530E6|nr:pseudaminic acid biosynthesis-associated methylase [Frateuria edaphi]UGB46560.1 methyltransferase domain-containing protein [Frateuria edaphi]
MPYKTEQEAFWAGEFGDDYIGRNSSAKLLASNLAFLAKALAAAQSLDSCIEFGANVGMNLQALRLLYPGLEQHAVEINAAAVAELRRFLAPDHVHHASVLEFAPARTWDLVLIKGVLIHINPDWLGKVYDALHAGTGRYLLVCEYYSPTPQAITYRGHSDRLFKRDFCGEILARHRDLRLVDYGFAYRGDPKHPQDDITWFLMEKHG